MRGCGAGHYCGHTSTVKIRNGQTYVDWIKRYISICGKSPENLCAVVDNILITHPELNGVFSAIYT